MRVEENGKIKALKAGEGEARREEIAEALQGAELAFVARGQGGSGGIGSLPIIEGETVFSGNGMIFIAKGEGGAGGTASAPVMAQMAKEMAEKAGNSPASAAKKPFDFEKARPKNKVRVPKKG